MISVGKLDKQNKVVRVYLSKAEIRMVKRQARKHGLSAPAYLRKLIRTKGDHLEK
jgi:predicted DNA binding CopG/RHH family protein